jgi:Phage integrase family/Arm DNA-binding domain
MAKRERGIHRLTPRQTATLGEGLHPDGGGLYLQVKGNSRSWLFRTRKNWMGLGPTHTINIDEAREKARICRQQMLAGIDPLVAREKAERDQRLAAAKEVTFRECAEGWIQRNANTWDPKRTAQIKRRLEMYAYPKLENGRLPIQKLDVRTQNSNAADLLFNVLKPLWRPKEEGGQLPTAKELRQDIECILDWAWAADYIAGDAEAMKAKLDLRLPDPSFHVVTHHAALDFEQVGQFMATLRACVDKTGTVQAGRGHCHVCSHPQREEIEKARRASATLDTLAERFGVTRNSIWRHCKGHLGVVNVNSARPSVRRPLAAYAIELLILTAVRKAEVLSAEWKQIDWDDKLLIVPWQKHKVGKKTKDDHVIPLSDAAMAVLQAMKEWQEVNGVKSDFVFPGGRGGTSGGHMTVGAVNTFLKNSLGRRDLTIHGFRTTFGSWSVEQGYEERDSEMALGHVVGNNVRNIYKRNAHRIEPRRLMMQAWADYCGQTTPPVGDVINAAGRFLQAK